MCNPSSVNIIYKIHNLLIWAGQEKDENNLTKKLDFTDL